MTPTCAKRRHLMRLAALGSCFAQGRGKDYQVRALSGRTIG
jgi:hypothetical protein